jgi:hypothetical protein
LSPSRNQLHIGLYDLTDPNARLPIQTNRGIVDAFSIATITINEQFGFKAYM